MSQQYQHILVPVDGSQEAEFAFKKAVQMAKDNENAQLMITHVVDTQIIQTGDNGAYEEQLREDIITQGKALLTSYESHAKAHNLPHVKSILEYGSPRLQICESLPDLYATDLIVIGATGRSAMERLFLGSVTEYVVRHAPCDVLVVRSDPDKA
ncbi:MAG: universal stress protein [Aerococcus sp.]|nr:universal stress protein [Aerococcus sp.]